MLSEISRSIVQIKKNINNNKKNIYVGNLFSLLIIDMKFQDNWKLKTFFHIIFKYMRKWGNFPRIFKLFVK